LAAKGSGAFLDRLAFRGGLTAERSGGEEGIDVGVAREVMDERADGADMELEPLGELFGGGAFEEVGAAGLVAARSWDRAIAVESRISKLSSVKGRAGRG
jgi:hypothetical protein